MNVADLQCMVFYAMEQKEFCLKWTSYADVHRGNFAHLLNSEQFTDVTLYCENQSIKCHQLVLSACSSYFEHILVNISHSDPIIILKDITFCDMQALVKFIYTGEVTVAKAQFNSLLSLADMLKVTGLAGSVESFNNAKNTSYIVEKAEMSKASPSTERKRLKRDKEKDVLVHGSLQDSISSLLPCTSGTLLINTSETSPCPSLILQTDVSIVKSELMSNEETTVTVSQLINSCQDHSEGATTADLVADSIVSFNCSNSIKNERNESPTEEVTDELSLINEDLVTCDYTNESERAIIGVSDYEDIFRRAIKNETGKSQCEKTTPRRKSSNIDNTSIKIERNKHAVRKYRCKQKEYFLQLKNEFEKLGEEIPPYRAILTKTLEDDSKTFVEDSKKRKSCKSATSDKINLSPAERSSLAARTYRARKKKYIKQLESILIQKRGFILK